MDWPTSVKVQNCSIGFKKLSVGFRSMLNGTPQNVELPGGRWALSLTLVPVGINSAGEIESLLNYLAGGVNTVYCWHFARPVPRGTMRGSPTVNGGVTRGATSIAITTQAGYTLKKGDMFGAGSQLFETFADATADGNGAITVQITNRVRATISNGAAVTWDRPKAQFACMADTNPVAYSSMLQEAAALELEEVW